MRVSVDVEMVDRAARPPAGASVLVEVRDTSLQDVSSVTLGRGRGTVAGAAGNLATIEVDYEPTPGALTAWAHVDVDGDGRVSAGDWVSMESFPVRAGADRIRVAVRPVTPASPRSPG